MDTQAYYKAGMRHVATFINVVGNHLPKADIIFDCFHVTNDVNDAVYAIRKEEEVLSKSVLKGAKYLFHKERSDITRYQRKRFQALWPSDMNFKTLRA